MGPDTHRTRVSSPKPHITPVPIFKETQTGTNNEPLSDSPARTSLDLRGPEALRLGQGLPNFTFPPAPQLLFSHFVEKDVLLHIAELSEELGIDVHVMQDLLQHGVTWVRTPEGGSQPGYSSPWLLTSGPLPEPLLCGAL